MLADVATRLHARFCQRPAEVYPALSTFLDGEVEPTNNHAERVQRRAVLWRRRYIYMTTVQM